MARREPDPYDSLVWDSVGGLGWIDPTPEGFFPSIGVEVTERRDSIQYHIEARGHSPPVYLTVGKDWDFAVIRACLDDAETRSKGDIDGGSS